MSRLSYIISISASLLISLQPAYVTASDGGHVDPALLDGHRYGPVRKEDTLKSIAWLMHRQHESIQKVIDELISDNPESFTSHGHNLKIGSYLERRPVLKSQAVDSIELDSRSAQLNAQNEPGYLEEKNPVIKKEMSDHGLSPDPVPFRQALKTQENVIAPQKSEVLPFAPEMSDQTVDELNDSGLTKQYSKPIREEDGGIWLPFLSGMLGGIFVLVAYFYFSKRNKLRYRLLNIEPSESSSPQTVIQENDYRSKSDTISHPHRARYPNDPVSDPSEQDILNWSKSLSAIQDMTKAEDQQSSRLNQPR